MPYKTSLTRVLIIAISVSLMFGGIASAAQSLSLGRARRSIATYERSYWHGQHKTISVRDCRRLSTRAATCVVEVAAANETLLVRDWATLLNGGVVRIHPGQWATEVTLS